MAASNLPLIIFFDAAGTLFRLSRSVGETYREVALRHGLNIPAKVLEQSFREAWKASYRLPTTRVAREDDGRSWWKSLVHEVFAGSFLTSSDENLLFDDLYQEFTRDGVWQLYPETREILDALGRKYRLGVISNFDGRLRAILTHLAIAGYFDVLVISSEIGAEKPDPFIYERACDLAGVSAAQALHVGDDLICDGEGAAAAGLRSLTLSRPEQSLADVLRPYI